MAMLGPEAIQQKEKARAVEEKGLHRITVTL